MQETRQTTETTTVPNAQVQSRTETTTQAQLNPLATVARLIYFILGVIETLLGLRVILALLGANPANGFAHFVYTASEPLARPFFSLFNYQPSQGISRLELGTIVAMVVYALLAWGIVSLIRVMTARNNDIIAS